MLAAILTVAGGAAFGSEKMVLTPEQSTGGVVIHLSDGTAAVTLDPTCKERGAAIEWKTPSPLAAGWWHGTLALCPRQGEEKSWVNTHVGIVLATPESPMVNMMVNGVFDDKSRDAQQFGFWIYTSAPAGGVRIESVYDQLYRYKRTWPVVRLTLEQAEPASLGVGDAVTLDLPVKSDGSVAVPGALPPGIWSLHAGMTREGTFNCVSEDGRSVVAPFTFDRWKRPGDVHFFLDSRPRTMAFKTAAPFKTAVLQHLVTRAPATPIPGDGELTETTDPARSQSAELVLIGSELPAGPPAFPLVPHGKKIVVMTTWDDGAPDDLRCADV
ncbi:MAG TPA: hypothetical protein VLJ39_20825, partial [Tepidisphaeraceae bacterium]|nr:hypothetical protein [Tepidisphaeraceae bacterium]